MAARLVRGEILIERIVHSDAKNELLTKRVERANKINENIARQMQNNPQIKGGRKDFNKEMSSVVSGNKF
jgi:hypothetical protein